MSGGVAVIQVSYQLIVLHWFMIFSTESYVDQFYFEHKVGAQTETELKEKKLRVEDALNATKVTHNYT